MKTDARVKYTRMRIRDAFFQCIEHKPVSKVTVKELCERAEINRATFYTHYNDPFDLMEKLENEMLDSLRQFIHSRRETGGDILGALLRGMEDSRHALLASSNGDPGFTSKLSALCYEEYIHSVSAQLPDCTQEQRDAAYRFIAGGCGSLITDWLNSGRTVSAGELARWIGQLCEAFLAAYGHSCQGPRPER